MEFGVLLVGLLVILLFAVTPLGLRYNAGWSYAPGGGLSLLLLVVISLIAMGRI